MSRRFSCSSAFLALSTALLVFFCGPGRASAQDTSSTADPGTAQQARGSDSGRSSEGIEVHGRWVLEVRDPDGTLVERREFENSLLSSGGLALSEILGGTRAAGSWLVGFGSGLGFGTASGPCTGSVACHIIPSGSAFDFNFTDTGSQNLQVTVNSGTVVLQGSHTVVGGDISWVGTGIGLCAASVAPDSCDTNEAATFTRKDLASAVTTTSGQVVSVTVTLSFS